MISVRQRVSLVMCLAAVGWLVSARVRAQENAPRKTSSSALVGAWTLNKDLSDGPAGRLRDSRDDEERPRRGDGGGFRRGGGLGGARRGGRGGDGSGRADGDPEQIARMRDAARDILTAAPHLTVVQSENMVIITTGEGRTTRLSPDGKKIKDESTRIERKTRWEGGKLVSEISGLPAGKVVETYAVDADRRQLHITLQNDGGRTPMTTNWVYDRDS